MNTDPLVPDLLRRFVPTPHVFAFHRAGERIRIESNDLVLAHAARQLYSQSYRGVAPDVLYWKLIRDSMTPCGGDPVLLRSGPLSIVLAGTGAILVFDSERREVLGFFSQGITIERFAGLCVPLLVGAQTSDKSMVVFRSPAKQIQTCDKSLIES